MSKVYLQWSLQINDKICIKIEIVIYQENGVEEFYCTKKKELVNCAVQFFQIDRIYFFLIERETLLLKIEGTSYNLDAFAFCLQVYSRGISYD